MIYYTRKGSKMMSRAIGLSVQRKEAWDKVTGAAKYTDDYIDPRMLHAKIVTSIYAHAKIQAIDISAALDAPGVQAVLTGSDFTILCGTVLEDRPPIAKDKVRYYGEPVAVVVATTEQAAMNSAKLVTIDYQPLPVVNSLRDALTANAPLIHENLHQYKHVVQDVYPEVNSNICNRVRIRKGDITKGWKESDVKITATFSLPQSDHVAMETRNARAEILPNGQVIISSSTQAPFSVVKYISKNFRINEANITVKTSFVGGAFGGKAAVQLEVLAYMASRAVHGKKVKIANAREDDFTTSPCKLGLEATVKLGASKDGIFKAVEMTYLVDTGAYSDTGPRMAKAMAVDCTGPYNIENVWCDALSVYTNHPYATSFRGFGHASYTFCIERSIDKLAQALGMDPFELRIKNAIAPGHTSPTQVGITASNTGDLSQCLIKLKELIKWDEGPKAVLNNNKIRAKGLSCLWKTSDSPTNASSGVILHFSSDGSINLNCGAVEIGPATKTTAAQILAEKSKIDMSRINVVMEVDTSVSPKHWKTVASMTTFMIGNAVLAAADDLINQIRNATAPLLNCSPDELEVADEWVYQRNNPDSRIACKNIIHGYKLPDGNSMGGQIIGRGSFIMPDLTLLDPLTGKGKAGPYWTVGAQAVEIEFDPQDFTYRLIKAATVIDAGKVINPMTAKGLVMGGMCMGLGLGTRESFNFNEKGMLGDTSLRTYKVMHYGQTPEYLVDFVETPQLEAPYGARGFAEHGIISISAALANALSLAVQTELDYLPLTPESIWLTKTGGKM